MKIKTNQVFTNLKGETLKEGNETVTLGMVISASLLNQEKSEDPKLSYKLAKECMSKDEVNLSVEDITYIKSCIKNAPLTTLLTGQALTILDI